MSKKNLRSVLSLDGVDDYVGLSGKGLPSGDQPVSMFAWIKTSTKSRSTIISYGAGATRQAVTMNVNQTIPNHFQPDFYNEYPDSGKVINDGRWHHIGFSYAGNQAIDIYVDGEVVSTKLSAKIGIAGDTPLNIGRWVSGAYYFAGQIAEFSVWNRKLTKDEARDIMGRSLSGDEDGLLGYWPLNGDAKDASGNSNHGTVNGASFIEEDMSFITPAASSDQGAGASPTVVIDLDKRYRRKQIKRLRKGKGKVIAKARKIVAALQADGTVAPNGQLVLMIVRK